ncbi:MAG: porin [Bacteroidota bacterium]|nr:porin [Bacteroidota bacterium]
MNSMKKLIVINVFVLAFSQSGYSQTYKKNSYYFDLIYDIYSHNYLSVKAAGKGYTGIAGNNDLSGIVLNPASLSQKDKFQIYAEYLYKWETPYNKYSSGNFYEQYNPTMLAGISYKINKDFIAGILYQNNNNYNFNFNITNELGEPAGKGNNAFSISSLTLPIVYSGVDMLKFGINLNYSFYSYKREGSDNFEYTESFEKFIPDFGIIYTPINNLSIGATFTPETSENIEYKSSDTNFTYKDPNYFPLEVSIGVNYKFEETPLTLSMDYRFINTSVDESLDDRNDFYFGMEYGFNKMIIIRSGIFTVKDFRNINNYVFIYIPDPGSYSQTFGTLGATVNIDKLNLNLSLIDSHIFSSGNITQTQLNFGAGYNF